ncbi:MAG: FtsW/RodA/SpoVE family cell cycle protein [Candidatus Baltobacteraceae bacterium]
MPEIKLALSRVWPTAFALAIAAFFFSFAPPKAIGPPWLLALLAVLTLAWVLLQPKAAQRDDMLPAIAVVLASVGLLLVARLSPELAHKQLWWLLISVGLAVAFGVPLTMFRRMASYKYVWVLLCLVLFGMLVVFGQEVNGAKLWIRLGPVQYEPVELIKLFIVFFLAAYLAETADVIARARPWSVRANLKYLGPLFLGWGVSMGILMLQRDIGMAVLLLATFCIMLYGATKRWDLLVGGCVIFGGAALWAVRHYHYVGTRIAVWRNPFADPLGAGYQAAQSYYSLAAGGVLGTGYRLGHPGYTPDAATDYIYSALSEEFGLIGALIVLGLLLVLVRRVLSVATYQPDLYTRLLAVGLSATLGFQVFIIVGGVIGLFPLTGITLPFISYGGSSLVANFLLVALAWSMSARPRAAAARG